MESLDGARHSVREEEFAANWERWHKEQELQRSRPHGFLAITGLHWLSDRPQRFDGVPGEWSSDDDDVRVDLADDEELIIEGVSVTTQYRFENVDEEGQWATFGDDIVEVTRRDGHFMIRPRDPKYEVRTRYGGTPTYPASTEWVAVGRFVPYDAPRSVSVGATVEGLTHVIASPGEIEFHLAGQRLRLIAFGDDDSDELSIVFRDGTSGDTTYAACRFLDVEAPSPDGQVTLDFNRATNPPCAYTDFTTCPLPPEGNDLPLRVEAGEKIPLSH